MSLILGRYSLEYRTEIVTPLMRLFQRGESACVVGIAGTGKSNLIHFLQQSEVKQRYLPAEAAARLRFVPLSCLPGTEPKDHIFEAMTQWVWEIARSCDPDLGDSPPRAVSPFQALRVVLRMACHGLNQQIVFAFDEFECLLRNQPRGFLDDLRLLRDDHRTSGNVVFLVITHRLPHLVVSPDSIRDSKFLAVIRDNIYPLGPHSDLDAHGMIDGLIARENGAVAVPAPLRRRIVKLAGGHPALLMNLYVALKPDFSPAAFVPEALLSASGVAAACDDVWRHLHPEERAALAEIACGRPVEPTMQSFLERRGLLVANGAYAIFSPVFREYIRRLPG